MADINEIIKDLYAQIGALKQGLGQVAQSAEVQRQRMGQALGYGKKPSKLEQIVNNVKTKATNAAKRPFNDMYNFFRRKIPRYIEGWGTIGTAGLSSIASSVAVYTAGAGTLGALALGPAAAAGVLAYLFTSYLAKETIMRGQNPIRVGYERDLKGYAAMPFEPIETSKKGFNKYIKNLGTTLKDFWGDIKYGATKPFSNYYQHRFGEEDKKRAEIAKQKQQGGS